MRTEQVSDSDLEMLRLTVQNTQKVATPDLQQPSFHCSPALLLMRLVPSVYDVVNTLPWCLLLISLVICLVVYMHEHDHKVKN